MKKIIGGAIAIILALVGFSFFYQDFFSVLAGAIPFMLIAGGALAIYIGSESMSNDFEDTADCSTETSIKDKSTGGTVKLLGNTESNVFHSSDCKFSKSENCTAVFNDRDKAVEQGYKPCGVCKP